MTLSCNIVAPSARWQRHSETLLRLYPLDTRLELRFSRIQAGTCGLPHSHKASRSHMANTTLSYRLIVCLVLLSSQNVVTLTWVDTLAGLKTWLETAMTNAMATTLESQMFALVTKEILNNVALLIESQFRCLLYHFKTTSLNNFYLLI